MRFLALVFLLLLPGCGPAGAAFLASAVALGENHLDNRANKRERCEGEREILRANALTQGLACQTEQCIEGVKQTYTALLEIQSGCDQDIPRLLPFGLDTDFFE